MVKNTIFMAPLNERIMELALSRSFLIPSNEIYGHTAGFYDYGPVGCQIKRKIENTWREMFVVREGFHEIETSSILPEIVLKASGHVTSFADPLVTCKKCKNKFRADHLLEEKTGDIYDGLPPNELAEKIKEEEIKCPRCKGDLESVGWFNLMFSTNIGPIEGSTAYARPETAQGIFMDFQIIYRNFGNKLPMGIAQVGKSFRNEISPRKSLLRLREFTQMEVEYFFNPSNQGIVGFSEIENEKVRIMTREGQEQNGKRKGEILELSAKELVEKKIVPNEIMAYFLVREMQYYLSLGIKPDKMYFRQMPKDETPHYSLGNYDMEVETSYGVMETIGNAYRTDHDLKGHQEMSKQDLSVFVEEEKKKIIPHVVEPSFGVDRLFWCMLEHCYRDKSDEKNWEWFDFPPKVAPYTAAVYPLLKKDGHPEKAREILEMLREEGLTVTYRQTGSIGRRYARADEIGVPYAITIDHQTLEDDTVTIRFRNDGKQERIKISELAKELKKYVRQGKVTL